MSKHDESQQFFHGLLSYIAQHPIEDEHPGAPAEDEEVRTFIRLFMSPSQKYDTSITSYGLKAAAERTIGYVFHGSSAYRYVSNDQFKRIMREEEFAAFHPKQQSKLSPNDIYRFHWTHGSANVMFACGVYGYNKEPLLGHNKNNNHEYQNRKMV